MEKGHARNCGLVRGLHVNNITVGGTPNRINYFEHFMEYTHFTWGTLLVAPLVEPLRYKPESRGFEFPMVSFGVFH